MLETQQKDLEQTILIGLITSDQDADKSSEYLDELAFLTHTAGGEVVKRFTQKMDGPNSATFVGTGKVETLKKFIEENDISTAIFDDELSAAQERNLSKILNCKVLDRTNLILDIFAQRAKTSYARTQVELAQCEYLLPRLRGMWTHLERQKGGIGMRGPGETEIETDRRIVRERIGLLKERLKSIDKQMAVQRGNRGKMVRVALVGYTNVGKSTLMNSMSKSEVFAEDKLFATLDTTVRKVVIKNLPFLLSDTVGFIRKLPTQLVEAFKSTLDEIREADFLIHVVDLSHPNFQDHMDSVNAILIEIGCPDKPTLIVFNKIDNYQPEPFDETDLSIERSSKHYSLKELESSWMANMGTPAVFVSVTKQLNMEHFKEALYQAVKQIHVTRFPYNHFFYPDDLDQLP